MSTKDAKITASTLDQIPYLRACIKETLRMYPVVLGNGRSLQSDTVISGYNVPKGVRINKSRFFMKFLTHTRLAFFILYEFYFKAALRVVGRMGGDNCRFIKRRN